MSEQVNEYQRRITLPLIGVLSVIFVSLFVPVLLRGFFERTNDLRGFVIVAWFVGTILGICVCCRCWPKRPQFNCPHCRKNLTEEWHDRAVVLSTGYCPKCMQPLFPLDNSLPSVPENRSNLLTRAEFKDNRSGVPKFDPIIPYIVGLFVIGPCFLEAKEFDEYRQQIGDTFWFPIYSLITLVVGGVITIGYMATRSHARLVKLKQCRCGDCGEALDESPLTLITGNCTDCGTQALAGRLPILHWRTCDKSWLRSRFREHHVFRRKWGWLPCVIGSAPAFLWLFGVSWLCPVPITAEAEPGWFLLLALAIVWQVLGIGFGSWWMETSLSLRCPQCRHSLSLVGRHVIASRNCPYCLTTIIVD